MKLFTKNETEEFAAPLDRHMRYPSDTPEDANDLWGLVNDRHVALLREAHRRGLVVPGDAELLALVGNTLHEHSVAKNVAMLKYLLDTRDEPLTDHLVECAVRHCRPIELRVMMQHGAVVSREVMVKHVRRMIREADMCEARCIHGEHFDHMHQSVTSLPWAHYRSIFLDMKDRVGSVSLPTSTSTCLRLERTDAAGLLESAVYHTDVELVTHVLAEYHEADTSPVITPKAFARATRVNHAFSFRRSESDPWESCTMLSLLHQFSDAWDEATIVHAVLSGTIENLQYAHEHGCPWDWPRCRDLLEPWAAKKSSQYGISGRFRYLAMHSAIGGLRPPKTP